MAPLAATPLLRTGVDLIDLDRVERSLERFGERFYKRFFTPAERAFCEGRIERLAARIAAKEAVAKALGTGIGDVSWVEIEVERDVRGRPALKLHGQAAILAEQLGLETWDLSISHTSTQAIAFVVALSAAAR